MTVIAAGVVALLAGVLFAALGLLAAAETARHRRRRPARALGAAFFLVAAVYTPLQLSTGARGSSPGCSRSRCSCSGSARWSAS